MGRRRSKNDSGVSGTVVVDKPSGMTSHDVVDQVRRRLGTRRVGHAGTLDPDATGVLVLGVGKGTKLLQFVTSSDKSYVGEVVFGVETATLDAAGEVTATYEMQVDAAEVAKAAAASVGEIAQIPPMVSAIKVDGKRLHALAREGIEVERKPRNVTVHSFETAPTSDPLVFRVEVDCSSGTYIRSLAADLGSTLGGGAHLRNLRRTAVGPFSLEQASPLEEVELRPVAELLAGLPVMEVDDVLAAQVSNGQSLGPTPGSGRLVITHDGEVIAVYEAQEGQLRAVKVLQAS